MHAPWLIYSLYPTQVVGCFKSKVTARRTSGSYRNTSHTIPTSHQVISLSSDPCRSTWLVSDLQPMASLCRYLDKGA
jgi:hypothetical protein